MGKLVATWPDVCPLYEDKENTKESTKLRLRKDVDVDMREHAQVKLQPRNPANQRSFLHPES